MLNARRHKQEIAGTEHKKPATGKKAAHAVGEKIKLGAVVAVTAGHIVFHIYLARYGEHRATGKFDFMLQTDTTVLSFYNYSTFYSNIQPIFAENLLF